MVVNDLQTRYDGICLYATIAIKPVLPAKIILSLLNFIVLSAICMFFVGRIPLAGFFFSVMEFLLLRYTLWNFFGVERLYITSKSLSYQHDYGFFMTTLVTKRFNRRISVFHYDEATKDETKHSKMMFESYDDDNLPEVIYYSTAYVTNADFEKFIKDLNQLFVDDMVTSYEMPPLNLN